MERARGNSSYREREPDAPKRQKRLEGKVKANTQDGGRRRTHYLHGDHKSPQARLQHCLQEHQVLIQAIRSKMASTHAHISVRKTTDMHSTGQFPHATQDEMAHTVNLKRITPMPLKSVNRKVSGSKMPLNMLSCPFLLQQQSVGTEIPEGHS